jgi:hypothetical protein
VPSLCQYIGTCIRTKQLYTCFSPSPFSFAQSATNSTLFFRFLLILPGASFSQARPLRTSSILLHVQDRILATHFRSLLRDKKSIPPPCGYTLNPFFSRAVFISLIFGHFLSHHRNHEARRLLRRPPCRRCFCRTFCGSPKLSNTRTNSCSCP